MVWDFDNEVDDREPLPVATPELEAELERKP
jgi:hypothetical protein